MPINPWIVPKKPREPGAAQSLVDIHRRLRSLERNYGVVGAGATITGAVFQSSDSNPKVILSPFGLTDVDGGGTTQLVIAPGQGIVINAGTGGVNSVEWKNGSTLVIQLYGWIFGGSNVLSASDGTNIVTLLTSGGAGVWPGSVSANSFITTSDQRLKENVQDLGERHHKIYDLRPVSYTMGGDPMFGFIAQELEQHFPEAVKDVEVPTMIGEGEHTVDTRKGINQSSLTALVVAAIQDLKYRLDKLEERAP